MQIEPEYVLVPRVPAEAMIAAASALEDKADAPYPSGAPSAGEVYTAMIAARPDDSEAVERVADADALRDVITRAYQQMLAMHNTTRGNGKDGHIWQSLKPIEDLLFAHSKYSRAGSATPR